jgi:hypothetical protein
MRAPIAARKCKTSISANSQNENKIPLDIQCNNGIISYEVFSLPAKSFGCRTSALYIRSSFFLSRLCCRVPQAFVFKAAGFDFSAPFERLTNPL